MPSRLSPQWLFGNSCTWAHDVQLHIAGTNEPKSAQYILHPSCFCEIWAFCVSWITYDLLLYMCMCLSLYMYVCICICICMYRIASKARIPLVVKFNRNLPKIKKIIDKHWYLPHRLEFPPYFHRNSADYMYEIFKTRFCVCFVPHTCIFLTPYA